MKKKQTSEMVELLQKARIALRFYREDMARQSDNRRDYPYGTNVEDLIQDLLHTLQK